MEYLLNINNLLEQKKVNKEKFCYEIGLKKQTFYNYLNKKTKMPVEVLIDIASYFNVSVGYFFGESGANVNGSKNIVGNGNNISVVLDSKQKEIEGKNREIEGKNRELALKDKIIEMLEK